MVSASLACVQTDKWSTALKEEHVKTAETKGIPFRMVVESLMAKPNNLVQQGIGSPKREVNSLQRFGPLELDAVLANDKVDLFFKSILSWKALAASNQYHESTNIERLCFDTAELLR